MYRRKIPLVELKQHRRTFGHDGSAINRHSIRIYQHDTRLFILDKTLDGVPPFYSLSEIHTKGGKIVEGTINRTILIEDEEYWGNGISWANAERLVLKVLGGAGLSRDTKMLIDGYEVQNQQT